MTRTDRRGRGGDGKSSATQETEGNTETSRREEMASGKELAAGHGRGRERIYLTGEHAKAFQRLQARARHIRALQVGSTGAGGFGRRPSRCGASGKLEQPRGYHWNNPKDTIGTGNTNGIDMGTGERNRQCTPPCAAIQRKRRENPPNGSA